MMVNRNNFLKYFPDNSSPAGSGPATPQNKWGGGSGSHSKLDKPPLSSSSSSLVSKSAHRDIFPANSQNGSLDVKLNIIIPKICEQSGKYRSGGSSYIHFLRVKI